jgi:glyoxylase-like metal-dependent hydrolase (beta-lactamase superfamily II)
MSDGSQPQYDLESPHRGWQSLATLFGTSVQPFDITYFLRGYEFSSNVYVMNGASLAIVDPGNDYTAFMEVGRLGIQLSQAKKVVLTHGHQDNAMGTLELLHFYPGRARGLELLMHEAGPREFRELGNEFDCTVTLLKGGEKLELAGIDWEVIHTPGHTVDGICLYHAPSKTMITGDTVLPQDTAAPDAHAGGRLDYYLASVRSLLEREVENLLPARGPVVASIGRQVIERTYENLMMKALGTDEQITWIQGATRLAEKGLLLEAVFCCDKQLSLTPEDLKTLQLKSVCLNDLGRFQEALDTIEQISRRRDPPPGIALVTFVGKGYALMGLGSYEESVRMFDQALKLDPNARDARLYKGMALYLAGKYEEALQISEFQVEFVSRFKDELNRRKPQ